MRIQDFRPTGTTGREPSDMFYRMELTGPQGAHYYLFKEPQHTPEDVARAKAYIRRNFDPVSINITLETKR